ncbi:MAG TPA: exonuclease domain-containing protein [Sphingobacteriaceae bacterium]|nr:exonuclease domain-containing protein [Sphingobacteriaceae bacterium]
MYAIVDIETTGGHASSNGISEIAIVIYNGMHEVFRFESLINPERTIPIYITALTGITNEMVDDAPIFKDIAPQIYDLLNGKIFVAHNVNFDYSFLKHHLSLCGFDLNCNKVCTVRLGRKIFPGLPSYSLGKLCRALDIPIINRHRALGDADATARLFYLMLNNDKENHLQKSLNSRSKEQLLPPNLPKEKVFALPDRPGVYYFHDKKDKVIYIGKAKSLKKRVVSHFSNNNAGKKKQEFLREIYNITYEVCGTELFAFILEALEIKRIWPKYNQSLKRFEQAYGLFMYEDQRGLLRLAIDKRNKFSSYLFSFNLLSEGYSLLRKLVLEYQLCPNLCFTKKSIANCDLLQCRGVCIKKESQEVYNLRVIAALENLKMQMPSFALTDDGRFSYEKSWILIERGHVYGIGYLTNNIIINKLDDLKNHLTPCLPNNYIKTLVHNYASRFPDKKFSPI